MSESVSWFGLIPDTSPDIPETRFKMTALGEERIRSLLLSKATLLEASPSRVPVHEVLKEQGLPPKWIVSGCSPHGGGEDTARHPR
jgi:hypothetical protein